MFVTARQTELADQNPSPDLFPGDILSRLIRANASEGKASLTEEEVVRSTPSCTGSNLLTLVDQIGNVFGFLFAGHGQLESFGASKFLFVYHSPQKQLPEHLPGPSAILPLVRNCKTKSTERFVLLCLDLQSQWVYY